VLGKLVKKGSKLFCVAETDAQLDVSKLARLCEFKSSDLASLLNVSERQMERSFNDILNMPPKSWLREQRMVYAKELFDRGMHKREVASITGFKSYSHFAAEVAHFFSKKPKDLERCNGKRSQVLLKQLG
jgi:transcriptional regulator GlxA family with amidase domain